MVLGGLWHGAAWTFVIWGAYHGTLLVVHRLIARDRDTPARGPTGTWLARAGMFHLVVLGWVFFRAPSFGDAMAAFGRLLVPGYAPIRVASEAAIVLVVGIVLHCAPPARRVREWFIGLSPVVQGTAYAAATIVAFFIAPASERFIYFQF
jgi:D-alanyl-lipoteichoic acid acyltransferase DltB (MBOAT superfamily)